MGKNMNPIKLLSNCCNAPALVRGKTTMYHVCSKCLRTCDVHIKLNKKEIKDIRKKEDF